MLATTSTTRHAPGAKQIICHHAEMDLTSSQALGKGLLLFQDEFSGSNPPSKVTINPLPEWLTAAVDPQEAAWKKEKKNGSQLGKSTFLGPFVKRDKEV